MYIYIYIYKLKTKDQLDVTCYLYFTSYVLNMFRTLIYPSSGACDYSVELPHWSYCSWFDVCWSFGVVGLECIRVAGWSLHTDTTPPQPNHNVTPTHIEPEQYNPLNNSAHMSQAPEDGSINIRKLLSIK